MKRYLILLIPLCIILQPWCQK